MSANRPIEPADDLVDIFSRLDALERTLKAIQEGTLAGLKDTDITYKLGFGISPSDRDVLSFVEQAGSPFGGKWKARANNGIADTFAYYLNGASVEVGNSENVYSALGGADFFTGSSLWFVRVSAYAPVDALSNVCGVEVACQVSTVSGPPNAYDKRGFGMSKGSWLGATGESGQYGWQARPFSYPAPGAQGTGVAFIGPGSAAFNVSGEGKAYILDDPGVSDSDFGSQACILTDVGVQVLVEGVRIWDAVLGSNAP